MEQVENDQSLRLRIGIFTDGWEPIISGIVTSVKGLAAALGAVGHHVTVIAPQMPGQQPDPGVVRIRSLPYFAQPEYRMVLPPSPRKLLQFKAMNLDVMHTHGIFLPTMVLALARALRVPLVHTYHTRMRDYVHQYPGYATLGWLAGDERWYVKRSKPGRRLTRVFRRKLNQNAIAFAAGFDVWYANRCQHIITPSQAMAKELEEMGVKTPISVIPNGIDLENLLRPQADPYPAFGVPNHAVRLLTVCRLDRAKSIDELLKRFARIQAIMPEAHLTIVGDGPIRHELESLCVSLGIRDKVVFCGYIPSKDIGAFYQHARLFLFASVSETQGLVALEATACGLPVVARADMGVTSCVLDNQTGFLVDPNDLEAFVDRALSLLHDPALHQRFAMAGRDWVKLEAGFDLMADRVLEVYRRTFNDYQAEHSVLAVKAN